MQVEQVTAWLRRLAEHRSTVTLATPGGAAFLNPAYPFAHDHNKLVVWKPCSASSLASAADEVLGGRALAHRYLEVLVPALADSLAAGLASAGYARERLLVLAWRGPPPPPAVSPTVIDLDLAERAATGTQSWRVDLPEADPAVWQQLGGRAATVADIATFLAVRGDDGSVAARADVFVLGELAQVEDVNTAAAFRRRGYASALVLAGVRRALSSGASEVFLIADAGDRPQDLYRRLGFTDVCQLSTFTR